MATQQTPNALYPAYQDEEPKPNALYGRNFGDVLRQYPNQDAAKVFNNWSQMSEPDYSNPLAADWMKRGQDVYGGAMGALHNSMQKRDDYRQRSIGGAYSEDNVMQALRRNGIDPYSVIGGGNAIKHLQDLQKSDPYWSTDHGAESIDKFINRFGLGPGS